MNYQESLKKITDQVILFYKEYTDDRCYYHNLANTVRTIEAIDKINKHNKLDDKSYFILSSAGWLHDVETIQTASLISEISSNNSTGEILQNSGIEPEIIIEIKKCVTAGYLGKSPETLVEKIFCDALTFYFGSLAFSEYNNLLRREIEAFGNKKISGGQWRDSTIEILENHEYHTEYCQSLLNKTKQDNLHTIIEKQEKKHWVRHPANAGQKQKKSAHELRNHPHRSIKSDSVLDAPMRKTTTNEKIENKEVRTSRIKHHLRGVETMFRSSSANHLRLSVMADNKAFIMISVNSILISVGIGLIIGKFVLVPRLFIPTVILLSVNVLTVIYSVLATRPAIMKGKFTREEVEKKTVDLLFFGSYYKMSLEDFEFGIRQLMDDIEFLYGNLIRDIYQQGKNLGRKYRLLRISYNIFMYGMVLSVLAYIVSFFF
jgi:hypothetical protein